MKKYVLTPDQIKDLVTGMGGCIATDRITVEGLPVRFMYRTAPHNPQDSGWAFVSATESDEYMAESDNHGIYDVNTIANLDRSIIPHLDTPAPCAFEKLPDAQEFVQVFDFEEE